MFAVVKNELFNGVTYAVITKEIVAHHKQYGEVLAVPSTSIEVETKLAESEQSHYRKPTNEELMGFVRDYRVILLAEVDWTQTLDCPLTDEKKAEFAAYRQALRDIPQTHPDPQSINWPSKPTL